jgi:tRNA uridine 5-carbamoylmethylation protein Kti12
VAKPSNQQVQFRLIQMPCCHTLICWVNPRRPNYCPECGKHVYHKFSGPRWQEQYSAAWLRIEDDDKANWVE